jgi:SAM-dependent methyltransferase
MDSRPLPLAPRPWFQDWFADPRYLELYEHRNDKEAHELVTLIEQVTGENKDRKVLDVACGAGRHLIAFARRGYTNLYGQDLSPTLIEEAKQEANNWPINFSVRDMRDPIPGTYDLILNIFTSFGYFATDEENEHVIMNCAAALPVGGHFVLDYLNAAYLARHLVAHNEKQLPSGEHVLLDREILQRRVVKRITFADGAEFIESVQLYESEEIEQMFVRAQLITKARFGSYGGEAFDRLESSRLILIAEKQ